MWKADEVWEASDVGRLKKVWEDERAWKAKEV